MQDAAEKLGERSRLNRVRSRRDSRHLGAPSAFRLPTSIACLPSRPGLASSLLMLLGAVQLFGWLCVPLSPGSQIISGRFAEVADTVTVRKPEHDGRRVGHPERAKAPPLFVAFLCFTLRGASGYWRRIFMPSLGIIAGAVLAYWFEYGDFPRKNRR